MRPFGTYTPLWSRGHLAVATPGGFVIFCAFIIADLGLFFNAPDSFGAGPGASAADVAIAVVG